MEAKLYYYSYLEMGWKMYYIFTSHLSRDLPVEVTYELSIQKHSADYILTDCEQLWWK